MPFVVFFHLWTHFGKNPSYGELDDGDNESPVLFGGFPSVLAGLGLGGHRSSLGVPGEVFLGRQGARSGSRTSSVVVESEPILCLGRSGSSIAVESELA